MLTKPQLQPVFDHHLLIDIDSSQNALLRYSQEPAELGRRYDPNGNLRTRIDPLLRVETYNTYDSYGNLTQFTDRKNQVTTNQYDPLNRRKKFTYHEPSRLSTFTSHLVEPLSSASQTLTRSGTPGERTTATGTTRTAR